MGKILKKEKQIDKDERIKKLDSLLARLDSPNEGDEVIFTMKDDVYKYKGTIQKKSPAVGTVNYIIVPKGRKPQPGTIETINYKGRIFNLLKK